MSETLSTKFDAKLLADKYAPSQESFIVTFPDGEELHFKPLGRKSELDAFIRDATIWYSNMPKPGTPEEEYHPFKGLLPETIEEAIDAFTISRLSVEPTVLSQRDALTLLKCPWLVKFIMDRINLESKTMDAMQFLARVEEAKKNLKETTLDVEG